MIQALITMWRLLYIDKKGDWIVNEVLRLITFIISTWVLVFTNEHGKLLLYLIITIIVFLDCIIEYANKDDGNVEQK